MNLFIPFPTLFSDSSSNNWAHFCSTLGSALDSESCAKSHVRPSSWRSKGAYTPCHKPQLWNHPLYFPITAGEHELGQDDRQEKYWGQAQKYS
jgi:hypothetical protein